MTEEATNVLLVLIILLLVIYMFMTYICKHYCSHINCSIQQCVTYHQSQEAAPNDSSDIPPVQTDPERQQADTVGEDHNGGQILPQCKSIRGSNEEREDNEESCFSEGYENSRTTGTGIGQINEGFQSILNVESPQDDSSNTTCNTHEMDPNSETVTGQSVRPITRTHSTEPGVLIPAGIHRRHRPLLRKLEERSNCTSMQL